MRLSSIIIGFLIVGSGVIALAEDPCLKIAKKSALSQLQEITSAEFEAHHPRRERPYGRFFRAHSPKGDLVVWTMPYANGKACVVRQMSEFKAL